MSRDRSVKPRDGHSWAFKVHTIFMSKSLPALMLLLLAAGLCATMWRGGYESISEPVVIAPAVAAPKVDLRPVVEPTLAWADEAADEAVIRQLQHLNRFFGQCRNRTSPFAASVLGWGSKWRFVVDKVPFTRGDRHAEFLRKMFAEQLFSDEELTRAIEQVARGYGDSVSDIENQMLVRLRQDVVGLPVASLPAFQDIERLQTAYAEALQKAQSHVGTSVNADVTQLVMSVVVQEVVTQVAVRLGVSAGVLSASAGSSWATFGLSIVAGVIIDQIVSWVWDIWADPQAALAEEMYKKVNQLERMIIEGDEKSPGLRQRLTEFSKQRSELRRNAVHALIEGATP